MSAKNLILNLICALSLSAAALTAHAKPNPACPQGVFRNIVLEKYNTAIDPEKPVSWRHYTMMVKDATCD